MSEYFEKAKLLRIEWLDHSGSKSSGWIDPDDIDNRMYLIKSVGYVVKETEDSITIAQNLAVNTGDCGNYMTILKKLIKRKRAIR